MEKLTMAQIEELEQFDAPTVCNAIEIFKVRPFNKGFMDFGIERRIAYDKPLVGYAATCKISAISPATAANQAAIWEYYESVKQMEKPTVSVIQDMDPRPIGSFWGDVQSSIHLGLGCRGVITSGGVRDLGEVEELGFQFFSACVLASHAYAHVEEYDCPVAVGGLIINPGDLLFADNHGITTIPHEIAPRIAEACRLWAQAEKHITEYCHELTRKGQLIDVSVLKEKRRLCSEMLQTFI